MRHLDVTVFEPGDILATMSQDGKVAIFMVSTGGALVPSDNRMLFTGMAMDDGIEVLQLSVRTYNLLKRNSVNTLKEMLEFYDQGEEAISEIRNFGQRSIDEVREHVHRLRGEDPVPSGEAGA